MGSLMNPFYEKQLFMTPSVPITQIESFVSKGHIRGKYIKNEIVAIYPLLGHK